MKAVVQRGYGRPEAVLTIQDIATPVPGSGEVLVEVHAASVHADIWHVVLGQPYVLRLFGAGIQRPNHPVPGTDMAGCVMSVGAGVTRFQPGDAVFGEVVRGHQWTNGGSFAERVVARAADLEAKPPDVSFEAAAAVPTSGLIAYRGLYVEGNLQPGQSVLINGAGGGVGTFAVQLAKASGATVTAVDRTDKLDFLTSLGADHVVDYTQTDVTQGAARFDLVLDIASNLTLSASRRVLNPDGTYVVIGHDHYGAARGHWLGSLPQMVGLTLRSLVDRTLPRPSTAALPDDALKTLADHLRSGTLTPAVDRSFPLEEIIDAMRFLQQGDVRGKIVVTTGAA